MISNIVLALVVAVAVGLGLTFLGMLLVSIGANSPILAAAGAFAQMFAAVLGLLCGLWFYFTRTRTL